VKAFRAASTSARLTDENKEEEEKDEENTMLICTTFWVAKQPIRTLGIIYEGYEGWTEGYSTPTFQDEKVKNLLSPASAEAICVD